MKLKGNSRFIVNNVDVLASLKPSSGSANSNSATNSINSNVVAGLVQEMQRLKNIIRTQNTRLDYLEFGTGAEIANGNGTATANASLANDQQRMNRFGRRINVVEQKLANLTERLTYDYCKSYPCQNGGTCFNMFDTFRCECPENYEGPMCNLDANECARFAGTDLGCQNGATCINTVGSYE